MSAFDGTWNAVLDSLVGRWDIGMRFSDTAITWEGPGMEARVDEFRYDGDRCQAIVTVVEPFPGRVRIDIALTGDGTFAGTAKAKILPPVKLTGTRAG